jgi:(2Fe-2S) ferredoxin
MLKYEVSEFSLVGQLVGFIIKDGYKIKYLRITNSQQEYWVKLSKTIRNNLDPSIAPGCWLEVHGKRKFSLKKGNVKLKAYEVKAIAAACESSNCLQKTEIAKVQQSKASILICQKSNCWDRGGKAICEMLEENLQARGLQQQISIKKTGCLKECKKGPNLVMMPDKAFYSHVLPTQIPELLEKHFD